jgi:hypothetical protein
VQGDDEAGSFAASERDQDPDADLKPLAEMGRHHIMEGFIESAENGDFREAFRL